MLKLESEIEKELNALAVRSILVAVSGGADSVGLLRACIALAPRLGLKLEAANCNFHLRGDESNRDSQFVEDLCRKFGVKLHKLDYDVEQWMARNPGNSLEMACRKLRYDDFLRILRERELDRVAVAHNADDDIETMLLNLLRGSGSRGLKGMEADTGTVVRPMLRIGRKEIERYLASIGQDYATDSSNLSSAFRRNFLRREVIPLLEERWPGARKTLSTTVSIMKEEAAMVEAYCRQKLDALTDWEGKLDVYNPGMTASLLWHWLEKFGGNASIAQEIIEATGRQFGAREWKLEGGWTAVLERDGLALMNVNSESGQTDKPALPHLIWEKCPGNDEMMREVKSNRNHDVAYLPFGPDAYSLRAPLIGDRMAPLGIKGTRLVSDIISDGRLSRSEKERVGVLVRRADGAIIWVAGLKRSRLDLIGNDSREIWKVSIKT